MACAHFHLSTLMASTGSFVFHPTSRPPPAPLTSTVTIHPCGGITFSPSSSGLFLFSPVLLVCASDLRYERASSTETAVAFTLYHLRRSNEHLVANQKPETLRADHSPTGANRCDDAITLLASAENMLWPGNLASSCSRVPRDASK